MKALTLWQPWASLVSNGAKRIETRSWSTSYSGPLAIHAAARPLGNGPLAVGPWTNVTGEPVAEGQQMMSGPWNTERQEHEKLVCPLGAIVATCDLVDVYPIVGPGDQVCWGEPYIAWWSGAPPDDPQASLHIWEEDEAVEIITDQAPFGDFTPGRFAWLLDNVVALDEPVPAKGHQGLWNWPAGKLRGREVAR